MQAGEHIQCLDLIKVGFPNGPGITHDCAILLEIWDLGALVQTSIPIPPGASISLESIGDGISAQVVSCEQDDYGFMVKISITGSSWFPDGYKPQHMLLN